jgi:hypothetical protein
MQPLALATALVLGACAGAMPAPRTHEPTLQAGAARELVLALGQGRVRLPDLIDGRQGLLYFDSSQVPFVEGATIVEEHACGDRLDRRVAELVELLVGPRALIATRAGAGRLSCEEASDQVRCDLGTLGEGSPHVELTFARDGRLQMVTLSDTAAATEAWLDRQAVAHERWLARVGTEPCP